MLATELKDIKDYWANKYPTVSVSLWCNDLLPKFFGKMITANESIDLNADTIGELIGQGETFLRRINR